jgi:hypothetical protein
MCLIAIIWFGIGDDLNERVRSYGRYTDVANTNVVAGCCRLN